MSKLNPETPEEIAARIADLKTKLAGRERLPVGNWGQNVAAIKAEIARLEALSASANPPQPE